MSGVSAMLNPRYRLDLFMLRGGWQTPALGDDFAALEEVGLRLLQGNGGDALAYRVRRARKKDYALLREGLYAPVEKFGRQVYWRAV